MDLDRMNAAPRDDQEVVVPQSGHRTPLHNMVDGGHLETIPNTAIVFLSFLYEFLGFFLE